jgi:triosephosphate isomerase
LLAGAVFIARQACSDGQVKKKRGADMIVAANWKMNPALDQAAVLATALASQPFSEIKRILFVPHPYLVPMSVRLTGAPLQIGGQDCHFADHGAYTGDVSAGMLRDCGASTVLLGHSERRSAHGESSDLVAQKIKAALAQNLDVVLCVGETKAERDDKKAEQVVIDQLQASIPDNTPPTRLTIAYEPVWAIGTGAVASPDDIGAMHHIIASVLSERFGAGALPPILYGGSVNAENAGSIFAVPLVGGALVGGASLDADAFAAICTAAQLASRNEG